MLFRFGCEAVIPATVSTALVEGEGGGNPVQKYWIPGQARNDNQSEETLDTLHEDKKFGLMYRVNGLLSESLI